MSEFYGGDRRGRVDRDDPPRARARDQLPRHGRHVRPVHQRGAGRPGDPRPARRGRARDEVRQRARRRTARSLGVNGDPEYVRAACDASLAAARRRAHRPLLPAPRRLRACRSRRRSARWPSSSRRARCATSGSRRPRRRRSAAPTPCTRSRRCRRSTRSGRATRRTRSLPTVPRARHRLRRVQPARARLPHRRASSRRRPRRGRLPPPEPALPGRELREEPRARRARGGDRRGEGLHAGAARARLGARAGRRHRADPRARSGAATWRRTRPRSTSS